MLIFDLVAIPSETNDTAAEWEAAAVERARRDPAEFAAIYHQYVDRVFYYVLSKADQRGDAEDITAQVFLDALEGLPAYRHRGQFAAWLFTIARHRLADFYRNKRSEPLDQDQTPSNPASDPLAELIQSEHLQRLAELVAHLNADERELLRLRFAADLNFAAIAELQRRKESAIKMSFYRLMARLKSQMEADHA